jgi:tetratricopeptide (TPR) repeat protein/TolB-like protein
MPASCAKFTLIFSASRRFDFGLEGCLLLIVAMNRLIQNIVDRRVLQAVGVFVGSCWVLVEIFDRLVDRYLLSPHWSELVFWGLYSLVPAVALIAWTHGKPGRDRVTKTEVVGVPINIIATIGLLFNLAVGKDLSATAELVQLSDEFGETQSHYVPKDSYRQNVALFFWDNTSGRPDDDWLQYGMAHLLVQDLAQNPYLIVSSPYAGGGNSWYLARMKQADVHDGLVENLSLMREIAQKFNQEYFVTGDIERDEEEFRLTAKIYETTTGRLHGQILESGWNLYPLVDRISEQLAKMLDVPTRTDRFSDDLPLAETYGESILSMRQFIEALNLRLFDNDLARSNELLSGIIEQDPGFVMAYLYSAINHINQGNVAAGQEALRQAQKLDYKLPLEDQVTIKSIIYQFQGQFDRLEALLKYQAELRSDAESYSDLAGYYMYTGDFEESKQAYRTALAKDSNDLEVYRQLAALSRATGDQEEAINYALQFAQERPEDASAWLVLGGHYISSGDFEQARAQFERARLIEDDQVEPLLQIANLDIRQGHWNDSRRLLDEAAALAVTPQQQSQVVRAESNLNYRLGKVYDAIELVREEEPLLKQFLPPLSLAFAVHGRLIMYYTSVGDYDKAEAAYAEAEAVLEPPLNQFLPIYRTSLLGNQGKFAEAQEAITTTAGIIEQFKAQSMQFLVELSKASLLEDRGDYSAAALKYDQAIDLVHRTVLESDMQMLLPTMYSAAAKSYTLDGDHAAAQERIEQGFKLVQADPWLWTERARLQKEQGEIELASASIQYALAIWKDADEAFFDCGDARELAAELAAAN